MQKQQQMWHTREMQHVVKREAIVGRRERKELAALKLQADRRMKKDGQKDGGVGSVLGAELVSHVKCVVVTSNGAGVHWWVSKGGVEPWWVSKGGVEPWWVSKGGVEPWWVSKGTVDGGSGGREMGVAWPMVGCGHWYSVGGFLIVRYTIW